MVVELPGPTTRWRCRDCGNLTRFDVVRQVRTREYWHFDLAGSSEVESREEIDASVASVRCRWCGSADAIDVVSRTDAG